MKCPHCLRDNPNDTRFCGNCGKPLGTGVPTGNTFTQTFEMPQGPARGSLFAGRYEIIEELGRGGMGRVFKAYDSKLREVVAIKILRPEIGSDEETIERFRNEIKLARGISQRHVCRMYDLGEEGSTVFISMEYVPGENLKSFIRRSGNLTEPKALVLARQICEGLVEAHRLGVVHRDLKPQNVMIDKDGNARIMDFGIASSIGTKGLTGTGTIIGTPEYMSPEQAEGRSVDARSDIYSLGVIIYEMVTGHVPFEGETPLSVAIKHKSEPPQDPRSLNSQVSPALSRVILKCLEKSRQARFQTAEDLAESLAALEKGTSTKPGTILRKKPAGKKLRIAVEVAVVALAVVVLAVFIQRDRPPIQPHTGAANHRFFGPVLKEASKLVDPKDFKAVETFIGSLGTRVPGDDPLLQGWSRVKQKFEAGQKEQKQGDLEASRKSYSRSQSEMNKLLAQVSEKNAADAAKSDMEEARKKADETLAAGGDNLLRWIAAEKGKDAADAYAKGDFSGAKTLYTILAKVYALSLQGGDETACLGRLGGLVRGSRVEADSRKNLMKDKWLYERAGEEEAKAAGYVREKRYPEAAEFYVLSAFLYEKARDMSLENAGTGD